MTNIGVSPRGDPTQHEPTPQMIQNPDNTAGNLIAADKVRGTDVYNRQGEHLGTIETVMINKLNGRVAYAIMSFGGFLGIGEKYHPLPWSMLDYETAKGGFVVDVDKSTLEDAPHYDTREPTDVHDREWEDRLHKHYGATPYWGL